MPSYPILIAITALALSADFAVEIPPVSTSLNISGQTVAIAISGDISAAPGKTGESKSGENDQAFRLNLRADLADFQGHLTPVLQAELNQSNKCGERISVENATLAPAAPAGAASTSIATPSPAAAGAAAPAGRLTVQLHFEKWACIKAFGKENARRLVAGNGTVEVLLMPRIEQGNAVRLDADVGRIDADGSLGELLRSGSLGPALRDKIREALLKAIQKSADFNVVVPEQARPFVSLQSIAFADAGGGRLSLDLAGRFMAPGANVSSLLDQFRNRK